MMSDEALMTDYNKLLDKSKQVLILQSTQSMVSWDMETKMPPKGISLRSQQLALLSQIEHRMVTDPEIGSLLKRVQEHRNYEAMHDVQKRNVYLIKKQYEEQTSLPETLVVETAKQQAIAIDTWKKAKKAKDFSMFKPELQKILDLKKQAAEILMKVKNTVTPYDALIDIYEPKMSSEAVATIFDELRRHLISIIDKCLASRKQPDISILRKKVPIEIQTEISNSITRFIGYDVESKNAGGRIDETEHPFTTGYYDDVRITTHYHKENVAASLFSVLHEGGHAIYEQNLRQEWMYQPIGASCSYGFHESQSRFVENMIGRSPEFWRYYFPKFRSITRGAFSAVRAADFMRAINHVKPSKIRIQADEVTYALHIIIRFEMERDMFSGKIAVEELPEIWNEKYENYLGVKIEDDAEGVMQDTHWASGLFGYFPSYALGNIYGGQLLTAMEKDMPSWRKHLAKGDFKSVKKWLIKNVYSYGNLYDPEDLLGKITGQKINVKNYIGYLEDKFSELYGY